MPEAHQRVELIRHTLDGEAIVALAAKLCYAGGDLQSLLAKIAANDQRDFLRKVREMGHESVQEHVSFTFMVEGVSRALLAQFQYFRDGRIGIIGIAIVAAIGEGTPYFFTQRAVASILQHWLRG